jgi:hypothetical protein
MWSVRNSPYKKELTATVILLAGAMGWAAILIVGAIQGTEQPARQKSSASQRPDDLFTNIILLCEALNTEGLHTRFWKDVGTHFQCITPYVEIGAAGPSGMATNIAYYVTGPALRRANSLDLVLNVNNRATRLAGKKRLTLATETLFAKLGLKPPLGLLPAIASDKQYSIKEPYGVVAFKIDRSNIDTLMVSIRATD